jgi:hypothetical protein
MASITVNYNLSEYVSGLQSYDLVATVDSSVDMSEKIFVFQDIPGSDPVFIGVSDPVDLLDYPEDEADLEHAMPFYRLAEVTLRYRSYEEARETMEFISTDVQDLVTSLNSVPEQTIQRVYL